MTTSDGPASSSAHTVVVTLEEHVDGSAAQRAATEIVCALDPGGRVYRRRLDDDSEWLQVLVSAETAALRARKKLATLDGVRSAFVKPPDALP